MSPDPAEWDDAWSKATGPVMDALLADLFPAEPSDLTDEEIDKMNGPW